jgi:hypothetical protein
VEFRSLRNKEERKERKTEKKVPPVGLDPTTLRSRV